MEASAAAPMVPVCLSVCLSGEAEAGPLQLSANAFSHLHQSYPHGFFFAP